MDFAKFFGTSCSVMGILFLQIFISGAVEAHFGKSAIGSSIGFGWFFILHVLVFVVAAYTTYRFWAWLVTKLPSPQFLMLSTEGICIQHKNVNREIWWRDLHTITTNSLNNDAWMIVFCGQHGANIPVKGISFISAPAAEKCIRIWVKEHWGRELRPFKFEQDLRL